MARFAWKAFEDELFESMHRALVKHARAHRPKAVYALGLHGLYAQEGERIDLPCLAIGVSAGSPPSRGELSDTRWNPADWRYPDIRYAGARALGTRVTAEATRGDAARWRRTCARLEDALGTVVARLRDAAPSIYPVTADFVAAIFEEECAPDRVRRTVPPALFARVFAAEVEREAARRARQRASPATRATMLVAALGGPDGDEAADGLVTLGAPAIPPLLQLLDDPKRGWEGAMLLGLIGRSLCRDAEPEDVDEALRALSSAHAVVRWQAAGALGQRELGKRVGARAVPALARLFDDPDARVRRLAILSFAAWRPAVGPHRAALERRCDDDDAVVRQTAKRLGRQPPR